jgi:ketosteroid isomerase-like protein
MTPGDVAENYWRIECTRDVAAILACYAPDAELVVPGLGRLVGHDAIRQFYQASVDRFPSLEVDIVSAIDAGESGAFEWRSVFKDHKGARYRSKGANIIRIRGDRFQSVHVYYDPTELDAPAAGEEAS